MKNISLLVAILITVFFASCNSSSEKIKLYTNNNAMVDVATKTITIKDTFGHNENDLMFSGGDATALKVKLPSGEQSIDIAGAGYYIVNAKARDTIIGGYQKYSTPNKANRVMTQEELAHNLDSLKQMLTGSNTNAANRTFFILPYTGVKISDNADAFIVGPYHRMTSAEKVGDKDPEIYRFYSIRELRETIGKLEKLTGAKPAEEEKKP